MHLYNAWLPPPVAEEIQGEEGILGEIVGQLERCWKPEEPKSKFATLKWLSLINNVVKSKVTPPKRDLDAVVRIGFEVFFSSSDNLFVQVRWATTLAKLLRNFHKHLTLELEWRKLYDIMLTVHFKRRHFFEGIGLAQIHLEALAILIAHSRRFFNPASALEIWNEFKPYLEDGIHNSSLEAVGFLSLFMPTKDVLLTSEWLQECLRLWDVVTDCPFWDRQWAALLSRFIKHAAYASFDFTPFLPQLFTHFLTMFEVPVAKSDAVPPIEREVPYAVKLAFSNTTTSSKSVSKAIIYLLKPDGHAEVCFGQLVYLLEQYYHPSNGGSWTASLEGLLRQLSFFFIKRLSYEQRQSSKADNFLGPVEREAFVNTVLRLIERAQYSKNGRLAVTASNVASMLAFVAPSVVLPFIVSRFEAAMVTVTATHQLESALTTLALSSRAVLLSSAVADSSMQMEVESERLDLSFKLSFEDCRTILAEAMFNTLLGMDANDPPKTLATLQFYCSVISSIQVIGEDTDGIIALDWSQWLDEFLSRLFVLLRHVESSSHSGDINLGEGSHKSSSTFLMHDESLYSTLVELLFGKLSKPLFEQAIKKVAKFVHRTILPGAVTEMGLLCSALVYAHPVESVAHVLIPIMQNVRSILGDSHSAAGITEMQTSDMKGNLSPATESSVATQITLLSLAIMNAGPALLQAQDLLKGVLDLCFSFSSVKVNEAGDRLLSSLIESLLLYYPLEQYKSSASYPGVDGLEAWIGTKDTPPSDAAPSWHVPCKEEIEFAEDIVNRHLRNALSDLRSFCQSGSKDTSGQVKDKLRVLFLRISGSLRGLRGCLPDFSIGPTTRTSKAYRISGTSGASVGTSKLREEAAEVLILACEYLLKTKADDTALLVLLVQSLDYVGNYGSSEYNEWANGRHTWRMDSKSLVEPRINFITGNHYFGKRRPRWMMIEVVYLHNLWRASQSGYRHFDHGEIPSPVTKVAMEVLKLSLHNYHEVRINAAASLKKILKRYPPLVKACMPLLTSSLQDPQAVEHSALGACAVLASRPVLRHVTQDWSSLAMFMLAVLRSSHHGSIKAQTAISELAVGFSVRFGGVPSNMQGNEPSYPQLLSHIKESLHDDSGAVHWRYKLMANVGLLCLVLPLESTDSVNQISESRKILAGEFFNELASDLPPLRPLSIVGLLLLLYSGHYKSGKVASTFSVEDALVPTLQEPAFAEKVVKNLSLDHHYSEGHGRSSSARSQNAELSVTNMIPTFIRYWPTTRNWLLVAKGDAFSQKFTKLFKRIVQECGPVALAALRGPLEQAIDASDERGMQCVAAELLAGLLHSDVPCVAEAWDDWLGPLFCKATMQANVESLSEWAASVRFSVSGKGRSGAKAPMMRQKVLEAVIRPVPPSASTSLIAKRLQYILFAVSELRPMTSSKEDMKFQLDLLLEVMGSMSHGASQVRQSIGKIMCVVCTNLQDANVREIDGKAVPDWTKSLLDGTLAATAKIQKSQETLQASEMAGVASETSTNSDVQESVKYIETMFQFLIAAYAAGRSHKLLPVVVGVLPSVLSLQETSHKDMSGLAKLAVYLFKWQLFHDEYRTQAVKALVSAARDSNWRTRVAALSFLQSFIFRHTFILDEEDVTALWNCVQSSLADSQLEVREMASTTLSGMLKGLVSNLPATFRASILSSAEKVKPKSNRKGTDDKLMKHSIVMGLRACVLSVPYDIPRWLPDMLVSLAKFTPEPSPISTTVRRTIAEFRRTHADTWAYQKNYFSEEQLEVLTDLASSASYFA